MEDDSDEELNRAIALSLEGSSREQTIRQNHDLPPTSPSKGEESGFSSDEDLKKAIALSLRSQPQPDSQTVQTPVIDLVTDDEEDDDLDAPVAVCPASLRSANSNLDTQTSHKLVTNPSTNISPETNQSSSSGPTDTNMGVQALQKSLHGQSRSKESKSQSLGLAGLNRKQMEEERLARARQKKLREEELGLSQIQYRKRRISSPSLQQDIELPAAKRTMTRGEGSFKGFNSGNNHPVPSAGSIPDATKIPIDLTQSSVPISQTQRLKTSGLSGSALTCESNEMAEVLSSQQQIALKSTGIQFPNGTVRKTWAYGFPRRADEIKIEEVLQRADLELAVLSAFQIDPDWIISKLEDKTKVIWVLQAKTEAEKQNCRSHAPKNYRYCFPDMSGNINCMHSKLQLLAHPTHLRVVVPSANLTPYDWGETGVIENSCFLIDLPRLPNGAKVRLEDLTYFGRELVYFTAALGLDQSVIDSLLRFDFSRTERLAFIHSIGGSHGGEDWKRTGYCGLGTAVQRLGLGTRESVNVDFITSSIGNLNDSIMRCLYLAAKGDDGSTEYSWRTEKRTLRNDVSEAERKLSVDIQGRFRIYFPLHQTVEQSRGGIGSAGTICFQAKWYDTTSFPKSLMRDCKSRREGLLMHNKMIFVRHQVGKKTGENIGWVYVGSGNLSESAWGRLVTDRATKMPKLNLRNWECGVLIPVASQQIEPARESPAAKASIHGMDIFNGTISVPMTVPGQEYGSSRPWFYGGER